MSVVISRATLRDAAEMAPHMRREDAAEAWADQRYLPLEALEHALALSGSQAWTVRVSGKIMAMWGVLPLDLISGIASPWALTTDEVEKHPKEFLRASKEAVRFLRSKHSAMLTRVDARYDRALRWARKIGFKVHPAVEARGHDFCTITMEGV